MAGLALWDADYAVIGCSLLTILSLSLSLSLDVWLSLGLCRRVLEQSLQFAIYLSRDFESLSLPPHP